jgi:hypothetical protein
MEYNEQKVIEFMKLQRQIAENRAILLYSEDTAIKNRAAIDLSRALPQYLKKVPPSIRRELFLAYNMDDIKGLEEMCKEVLKKEIYRIKKN